MTTQPIGSASLSVDPARFRELREVGCVRSQMLCPPPRTHRWPVSTAMHRHTDPLGLQLPALRHRPRAAPD
eukprot:scaffold11638_cov118-Isochrysis_galbana.AAC.2